MKKMSFRIIPIIGHQKNVRMIHLQALERRRADTAPDEYPYNTAVIKSLTRMEFTSSVTFLVGENGSGKSTLLEAIACAAKSITVGSQPVNSDPTLLHARQLAKDLRLTWGVRTHKGFFLRAEDFFGYAKQVASARREMMDELDNIDREYQGRSDYAKTLASMPYKRELGDIQSRYGDGLDAQSHGESFIKLFQSRFVPGGLYILDEPEAPLSPKRQLGFLSLLKEMVDLKAQFIIASHSPILMAFPDATILELDGGEMRATTYNDVEHVRITRHFLQHPESFLRHL